jgi:acyl carrier protein
MQEKRELILRKVKAEIAVVRREPIEITEQSRLIDLGLDSMGIIATLLMLEREVGLDFDRMISSSPPKTLGDLVTMAASGITEDSAGTITRSPLTPI